MSRIAAIEHFQRNAVQLVWYRATQGVLFRRTNVKNFLKAHQLDAQESSEPFLQSCGASDSSARTMARAERRFGMASIARSNANANPDVSLELARSVNIDVNSTTLKCDPLCFCELCPYAATHPTRLTSERIKLFTTGSATDHECAIRIRSKHHLQVQRDPMIPIRTYYVPDLRYQSSTSNMTRPV